VEALADAVGLWALGLGARVIDVLDREVELVLVPLWTAAAVGQHPQQLDLVVAEQRKHPIIEQIGRRDRGLAIIELGASYLAVGIDEGSAGKPARPPSDCRRRTCPGRRSTGDARSRTRHGPPSNLGLFQCRQLGFGQHPSWAIFTSPFFLNRWRHAAVQMPAARGAANNVRSPVAIGPRAIGERDCSDMERPARLRRHAAGDVDSDSHPCARPTGFARSIRGGRRCSLLAPVIAAGGQGVR